MNNMQTPQGRFEENFFSYLSSERGYPEQSLIRNMILEESRGRQYEVDLVVVDPERGDPLAVVEIKGGLSASDSASRAVDQVRRARYALGKPSVPAFVVFFNGAEKRIIAVASSREQEDSDIAEFPSFSSLLLQARSSELITHQKEKKAVAEGRRRTVDHFRVVCWFLATLALALFVVDVIGHFTLSSQQISLLGVFAALLLLPDVAKLKLLGVEFERQAGDSGSSKGKGS